MAGVKPSRISTEGFPVTDELSVEGDYSGDDVDWDTTPGVGGQDQWKQPCRVATTGPVTIATALNAGDAIDGVTLAAGDRVLVALQASPEQNGIYVAGPTPARAADMDDDAEVLGALVMVLDGDANGGSLWRVTNTDPVTVDSDPIFWARVGGVAGGGILYFVDSASDIGGYGVLDTEPDTAGEDIDSVAVTSADGELLIESYATAVGVPGVTVLPSGQWEFHHFATASAILGVCQLVFRVYKRALDTTETELFSVTTEDINNAAVDATADVSSTTQPDFSVLATDRLVVKVYAKTSSAASRTIAYYHSGTQHYSHLVTPLVSSGGTGGPLALDDLTDVNAAAPADRDVLTWDDGAGEWVAAPTGPDVSLSTVADAGATETLDVSVARTHDVTLTEDCTFTFTGSVTAEAWFFSLVLRQDGTGGWDATWPGSVVWPGGSAPTLDTAAGAVEVLTFFTLDGGSTWYGFPTGATSGTPATTVTDETTFGLSPAVGTDTEYARQDHTHGTPDDPGGASGHYEVIMVPGITDPPEPLLTEDGTDWVYGLVS